MPPSLHPCITVPTYSPTENVQQKKRKGSLLFEALDLFFRIVHFVIVGYLLPGHEDLVDESALVCRRSRSQQPVLATLLPAAILAIFGAVTTSWIRLQNPDAHRQASAHGYKLACNLRARSIGNLAQISPCLPDNCRETKFILRNYGNNARTFIFTSKLLFLYSYSLNMFNCILACMGIGKIFSRGVQQW